MHFLLIASSGADPIKLFFSFFGVEIGHFTINFFLYVTNAKAYQQKMEKIFVIEKKSFIGLATGLNLTFYEHLFMKDF